MKELGAAAATHGPKDQITPILTNDDVDKMKVTDLNQKLKKQAYSIEGNKKELIIRQKEALEKNIPLVQDTPQQEVVNFAGEGFSLGAKWQLEEPSNDVVEDTNERLIKGVRSLEPTVNQDQMVDGLKFS